MENKTDDKTLLSYLELVESISCEILSCENKIQNLQDATAATYEGIAENLPKIMDRIDSDNEEACALIEYFISDDESLSGSSVVIETLDAAKKTFEEVSVSIRQMFKKDQHHFKQISEKIGEIENLRKSILEIVEISNDIELLSYNSVFVASQAGSSGAAFTYIATEIKSLSNQTKSLAYKMRQSSDKLMDNYKIFNDEFDSINHSIKSRLNNLDQDLSGVFDKYFSGLKNIAMLIKQTLDRASDAKNHVPAIMMSLQAQDLIRQLLDQISLINNDLATKTHKQLMISSSESGQLKSIEESSAKSYARAHLAKSILNRVTRKLSLSVDDFDQKLRVLRQDLNDVEQDRVTMIDFFSNRQSGLTNKSSIELIFDESAQVLNELVEFINSSTRKKREASHHGLNLKQTLAEIESNFENMRGIIKQFNIIKVISKMEIAREAFLSDNITASSEMFEELTHRMDKNIVIVRSQLDYINHNITSSLDELENNIGEQENIIVDASGKMQTSIDNLDSMRNNLNETIKSVGKESTVLFELLDESIAGTEKIRNIIDTVKIVSGRYETILEKLDSFRSECKKQSTGVFSQPFDISRFEDLVKIDRTFSVYTAHDDGNNDSTKSITEGNEGAGELVMF
ncbi:hypothetical protein IID10_01880 [candidate division KSB1 bacterium]|nr:hypothetical protein [candidate division KSB1 bacterium]